VLLCIALIGIPLKRNVGTMIAFGLGFVVWAVLTLRQFSYRQTALYKYHDLLLPPQIVHSRTAIVLVVLAIAAVSFLAWFLITFERGRRATYIRAFVCAAMPAIAFGLTMVMSYALTLDNSWHTRNAVLSRWITGGVQECINSIISRSQFKDEPRSFVFVTPKFSDDYPFARHDLTMSIVEQPEKLGGRTFGQWRYGYSPLMSQLNTQYARARFVAWPHVFDRPNDLIGMAAATFSPFVVAATDAALPADFVRLGKCDPPEGISPLVLEMNHTLKDDIYVYHFARAGAAFPRVAGATYGSSTASFRFSVAGPNDSELITLPIVYQRSLRAASDGRDVGLQRNEQGYAQVASRDAGTISLSSQNLASLGSLFSIIVLLGVWPLWRRAWYGRPSKPATTEISP
jgi:hypothetical protein